MPSKTEDILDSLRRIIGRWTITTTTLTKTAAAGDVLLKVDNTIRFHDGDEIILRDVEENTEPLPGILVIDRVIDQNTLLLTTPLQIAWPLSVTPSIFKTIKGQYVKAIHIGEPSVIEQFPAITVNGTTRASEWMTTRGTKERYNIEIGVFVEDATMEDGYRFLLRLTDLIQDGLKKNIYPLVNDYEMVALTADMEANDLVVKVADSSIFCNDQRILIEDKYHSLETMVTKIIDGTTIQVYSGANYKFLISNNAVAISPKRFIYNSWPAEINYGKIHKGTLLKAAVINYFAEEYEIQFQFPWPDTQIK